MPRGQLDLGCGNSHGKDLVLLAAGRLCRQSVTQRESNKRRSFLGRPRFIFFALLRRNDAARLPARVVPPPCPTPLVVGEGVSCPLRVYHFQKFAVANGRREVGIRGAAVAHGF